jgi:hypothetical protein
MAFEPVIELTDLERVELVQTCATSGFKVIHRILRSEVDKFVVAHMNVPVEDKDLAYARFVQSKTAAQIYQGMTDRINLELSVAVARSKEGQIEEVGDTTEGLLDIGEASSGMDDLPNLLGDYRDDILEGME